MIVVMVLFFIISMVAAYTSRNLLFEQKTSANQLRSTQSFEAADAGLQWALGLLNSGRITDTCQPTTDTSINTFRQRYLSFSVTDGAITPVTQAGGADLTPGCVFDGTNWVCSCPANGAPVVATPTGNDVFPAYRVRFRPFTGGAPAIPQIVRIEVVGCTRNVDSCLSFTGQSAAAEGRTYITALLTIKGAMSSVPVASLTSRGPVNLGGAAMTLINANPKGSGITIQAGGAVATAGLVLNTIAGSPESSSYVENDASLSSLTADLMFNGSFGLLRTTYRDQPGAVVLTCGGSCTASQVRTAGEQNPDRIIWVDGDLSIDSGGDIGSDGNPLAIVVNGNLQFSTPANVFGFVYVQAANWNTSGIGSIKGAAVAEGNVGGTATTTIIHDKAILDLLRYRTGTMVVVPGSWRDFT